MLLYLLLGPASRSAEWPQLGKRARIELVIYPAAADELRDAWRSSLVSSCGLPCTCLFFSFCPFTECYFFSSQA